MAESDIHRSLVQELVAQIQKREGGPWFLFVDGDHELSQGCPPQLDLVRPDVFARSLTSKRAIIAEAKTSRDIENEHTLQQLGAYLRYLSSDRPGAELLVAVPFAEAGLAHRICRQAKRLSGCEIVPFEVVGSMFGRRVVSKVWRG